MRLAFLTIADAANNGPDGKLNFLGAGVRILRPAAPDVPVSIVIAAQVDADNSEAGRYPVRLTMTGPDGDEVMRLEFEGAIDASADPDVPTGFGVVISVVRPFPIPGLYRLTAVVEGLPPGEYVFKVMPPASSAVPAPGDSLAEQ